MDDLTFYSRLRAQLGDPKPRVENRDLATVALPALEWLAAELECRVIPDAEVGLTEDAHTYPLPEDCARLLWIEHNSLRLTASSVAKWVRDRVDWRNADSATPLEFAVQGRSLVLYPPPGADAVEDDGALTLSYLGFSPGMSGAGVPGFTDADLMCAVYRAAWHWLGMNPGSEAAEVALRAVRRATALELLMQELPQAKRRHEMPVQTRTKRFKVGGRAWRPAR
jgi:hypothetical protein